MAISINEIVAFANTDESAPTVAGTQIVFSSPLFSFGTATSGAGTTRTIKGQNAQASGNLNGGDMVLQGGAKNGSGTAGVAKMIDGDGFGVVAGNLSGVFSTLTSASGTLLLAYTQTVYVSNWIFSGADGSLRAGVGNYEVGWNDAGFSSPGAGLVEVNNGTPVALGGTLGSLIGAVQPRSMADGTAANNTIYYSTTASKLVYKDSGGTVNNLY